MNTIVRVHKENACIPIIWVYIALIPIDTIRLGCKHSVHTLP